MTAGGARDVLLRARNALEGHLETEIPSRDHHRVGHVEDVIEIRKRLRAFELPAFEAIPAGAPVELNGSVTALWPAPDLRSAVAILETRGGEYEVDRVTALCN